MGDVVQKVISENNYVNGGSISSTNMFGDSSILPSIINDNTGVAAMTGVLDSRFDDLYTYKGDGGVESDPIVTTGLVLHLDAGNTDSYSGAGSTWTDMVGGHNATLYNSPTYSSTSGGGSFAFDGSNDYGVISRHADLEPTSRTLEAWIKYENSDNSSLHMVVSSKDSWSVVEFQSWLSPQARSVIVSDSDYHTLLYGDQGGSWTHFVSVQDASAGTFKIYVNDSLIDSTSITAPLTYPGNDIILGAWGTSSFSRYYNGELALFRMYSSALSAGDITQNYDAQKARFGH